MTVSATAPVCYQLILPKSPEYASPAMKLCQPLREPVESRHSDDPGCAAADSHRTQPAVPSALQSQRKTHLPAFEFQPPARGTANGRLRSPLSECRHRRGLCAHPREPGESQPQEAPLPSRWVRSRAQRADRSEADIVALEPGPIAGNEPAAHRDSTRQTMKRL